MSGGGKETPRQKMIGMMYLVLTALLAMNVSKDILNAFVIVNGGLEKTNSNFAKKNDRTIADFDRLNEKDPVKTKPYYDRAKAARKLCGDLNNHILELKKHLILETDKLTKEIADTMKLVNVNSKDNYDIPTHILIGDEPGRPKSGPNTATELKGKFSDLRKQLIELFGDEKLFPPKLGLKKDIEAKIGLETPDFGTMNGTKETWETGNFNHLPLAAVITNLSKMQNDIKNAESDVLNALYAATSGTDVKFDKLVAKVIAPSSYILAGEDYTADVLLVAYNSTTNNKYFLGNVDTTIKDPLKNPIQGAGQELTDVSNGAGHYTMKTSAEGLQKWSGVIAVESPEGLKYFPFSSEYRVAKPAISVSPDKMNVFYIGVDNPVTINAAGVAVDDLSPSMQGGTISGSKGKYIVRVSGGTEATINVSAKSGGSNKSLGPGLKFRVKRIPDPVAYVASKKGDETITKGELTTIQGVQAKLENFDFDLKFDIVSFDMSMNLKGSFVTEVSQSNKVTSNMSNYLKQATVGTRVYFENVKAKGPDGTVRKIPGVSFKVK